MEYNVFGIFTASKFLGKFEANSPEEAEEMAANAATNHAQLCHQCAREVELEDYSASTFQVEEA